MPDPAPADPVAAELAAIREREQAATRGPWEAEDDEDCWRLFGAVTGFLHPMQLAKAPKHGTPYAEYWPNAADAAFIVAARSDVPRLLAALEAVLAHHQPGRIVVLGSLCKHHENCRHFSITSTEAADVAACANCTATVYSSCLSCGDWVQWDQCPARAAISRALTGEEVSS